MEEDLSHISQMHHKVKLLKYSVQLVCCYFLIDLIPELALKTLEVSLIHFI